MFHFVCPFLDPPPITILCVAPPVMSYYGKLRSKSISLTSAEIHSIRTPLDHRTSMSSTCSEQAHEHAKLLILCNFRLGGMIRCLGGAYKGYFLDFSSINACLLTLSYIPVYPGDPPCNFPELQHFSHHNIPFKDSLQRSRKDMLFINPYNNHRASDPYLHSQEVRHQYP